MLDSRGWAQGFRRLGLIFKRFGLGHKKQTDGIAYYASILSRNGVRGTFFIPGAVLKKYSNALRNTPGVKDVDWGVHGDVHTDLSAVPPEAQRVQIKNAVRFFDAENLSFKGFRAPYLKTNETAFEAIGDVSRFAYDSSVPVLWERVYGKDRPAYEFIRAFYRPEAHAPGAALPKRRGALVEIPVSLPDDDVLVDREGLSPGKVLEIWTGVLEASHAAGEIFVLQLHPERIYELGGVLEALIRRAKKLDPPVWIASLAEIAEWTVAKNGGHAWPLPYRSVFSVSGDIDSITLGDFAERLRTW